MRILTVISNYNEEHAIVETIKDVRNNSPLKSDLLVIDNCSTDESLDIIKSMDVDFIEHPVNTGGSAGVIKTALAYAHYRNYDIYCHLDGDNQHNAVELGNLIRPLIEEGTADIVVGSRFIEKQGFQSLFLRRITIYSFSRLLSLVTGTRSTDFTSGFRAYNKRAINFFATQFSHEIETPAQLELLIHYSGLRKTEVPVTMKPRKTGKSEINFKNAVKFPIYNIISIIGTLINRLY